jgi:hypothetical protein
MLVNPGPFFQGRYAEILLEKGAKPRAQLKTLR